MMTKKTIPQLENHQVKIESLLSDTKKKLEVILQLVTEFGTLDTNDAGRYYVTEGADGKKVTLYVDFFRMHMFSGGKMFEKMLDGQIADIKNISKYAHIAAEELTLRDINVIFTHIVDDFDAHDILTEITKK